MIGPDGKRALQTRQRLVVVTERVQRLGAVAKRSDMLWCDSERLVVALDCCLLAAEIGQRDTQVDERFGMLRIDRKRPLIARDGLLPSIERVEHEPAIVERVRAAGSNRQQRIEGQ